MSSTTTITKPAKARPASQPVDILDRDISRVYTHINPLLILSMYYYRFSSIVADPVSALSELLVPLSILQIAYVFICLPPAGSNAPPAAPKAGARKKAGSAKPEDAKKNGLIPAVLSVVLSTILGTPILTVGMILFGAPLTTHMAHTVLAAAHISLLAAIPLIYVHGVDGERWREIAAFLLPLDEVFGAALGTLLGAWLGAIPIPLDWDREWQKWPVTIVTGAYIGYAVGKLAGGFLLKGRRIKFEETQL